MRSSVIRQGLQIAGVASLVLGLSAVVALAGNHGHQYGKLAAKQCQQERKLLGNDGFREVHGKPAMPHCIGVTKPEVKADVKNASQECRAERNDPDFATGHDGKSFQEFYGNNKNGKNAFGKCVSGKVKDELSQDRADVVNAAKDCKAEQADPDFATAHDGKSFDQFYGSNKNGKNAFGKCVSTKAQAADSA